MIDRVTSVSHTHRPSSMMSSSASSAACENTPATRTTDHWTWAPPQFSQSSRQYELSPPPGPPFLPRPRSRPQSEIDDDMRRPRLPFTVQCGERRLPWFPSWAKKHTHITYNTTKSPPFPPHLHKPAPNLSARK